MTSNILTPSGVLPANSTAQKWRPQLDTLAQLTPCAMDAGFKGSPASGIYNRDTLKRRARSKYFTNRIALPLADLRNDLEKYYRGAYYCNSDLIQQGQKITGKYCNSRICNNCNRIRTAKLINGYQVELEKLNNKQFVTLTAPNVSAIELPGELRRIYSVWRKIMRRFTKRRLSYGGLRKLEITYNPARDNKHKNFAAFHPHLHIIINDEINARVLLYEWLHENQGANISAQNITPVNDWALMELFKYSTKIVYNPAGERKDKPQLITPPAPTVFIRPLDVVFRALYGRRIIQNFGTVKKQVSEDVEELSGQEYNDIPYYEFCEWKWKKYDWVNSYGELLSENDADSLKKSIKIYK